VEELARLSDDELLALAAEEPEAFGVFYERHARVVLGFLARACRDTEQALDLTAEVFAAALAASGRYRSGEAPAGAWLMGIARNKLAATRRRNAVEDKARRRLGMARLAFADEALERVEELLDAEPSAYVNGMGELSAAEREAVTARVIEERDYTEIAEATGSTEAAVRQRVSRGLAKLARLRRRGR
jgi:RNA polymerase sigma-70 factor (ECF subfamily)